mgnify:CR=1 FL=1
MIDGRANQLGSVSALTPGARLRLVRPRLVRSHFCLHTMYHIVCYVTRYTCESNAN